MAGNQITGDGLSVNIAGMSKNQLYDIMSQMKTLIEQNQDQARQILIQNPLLTKALFQAQIMLGMLQPPQEVPAIQPAGPHHSQPAPPPPVQPPPPREQTNPPSQQTIPPPSSSSIPPSNPSLPPLQPTQHGRAPVKSQAALPPHYSSQPPMAAAPPPSSAPLQQNLHISHVPLQPPHQPPLQSPHQPPHQPPLPSQPRPPSMQSFPHQNYSHMGPTPGFQPQMHHSQQQQPMFHSGSRPPTSMGPAFSQGQALPPSQQMSQGLYQGGGGSHVGMDFNQMGIPERGSNWMPETQVGPTPSFLPPSHMTSSASQPPRPASASLSADMEKALLQQVMSLTPDQINLLPPEQRNQVLHLQQMLRQ